MKKITDFIVEKRYIVLTTFLLITFLSSLLIKKVEINKEISKYLPNDSETRIGMDIMDDEFSENSSSTLNLMFKGLSTNEKDEILDELKKLDSVDEVLYDNTSDYNKDDYTLYIINTDVAVKDKKTEKLYKIVEENYKDYEFYTSGEIAEEYKTILPIWIIILAIGSALVILIIMSKSYIEPFLFLTSIGIAVILNKGTNIIFGSISNITDSISAILQLALSMDYSIMLMNRYTQECEKEKDKIKAMKKALYDSFGAISSSSVTTIVGLLALVFMSFTIGKDLGFVLAKGVLFSLLSIFTCLPALILMFDKIINKTKKKYLNVKMDLLGKFVYKIRYLSLIIFVLCFLISFALKGNLSILYTDSETDNIAKIFSTNNQMAIIYNNKYEDKISDYCKELENNNKIDEVLCYGNTINEELKYNELNNKLNSLGETTKVDDYLIKLVYYNYYNKDENNKMTFSEFVNFIKNDVYNDNNINKNIDDKIKNNVDKLSYFTNINEIEKLRTSRQLSDILEINKDDIDKLLIYYNSLNNNTTMSINEFVNFMNNYILKSEYANDLTNNQKTKLNTISNFIDKNKLNTKLNSSEISTLFELDKNKVDNIYLYYVLNNDNDITLTLNEFANFVSNYILDNSNYNTNFNEEMITKIKLLSTYSNKDIINSNLNYQEMSQFLGIDEDVIKKIYLLIFMNNDNNTTLTINEFLNYSLYIKNNTNYLDDVDMTSLISLSNDEKLMNIPNKYTSKELSLLLGIDENLVNKLYTLIDFTNNSDNYKFTPFNFVLLMLKENIILENLDNNTLTNLKLLYYIMDNTNNDTKYDYVTLSNSLNLNISSIKQIYSLYSYYYSETTLTPKEFIDFILNHKDDEMLVSKISNDNINNLTLLQTIINNVLSDTKYNYRELSSLFNIDLDKTKLLYSLYEIKFNNKNINISLNTFIDFLLDDVITNSEYSSSFDNTKINKLNTIKGIINGTPNNTKYTKEEIFAITSNLSGDTDNSLIDLLYIYYGSKNEYDDNNTMTIEEFINYLNEDILTDNRFDYFIDSNKRNDIISSKEEINDAKKLLIGKKYSRAIINTKYDSESDETFDFIKNVQKEITSDNYIIGNSPMAYEMSKTFNSELNFITILTMIFIFIVVVCTFKSLLIPIILVLLIQTAVYLTMGIMSFNGGTVYFIALLIVQSILMGATIDYAILYTSYYIESRNTLNIKDSIINSYNKSIHTILTSSSILIIVTLIVGHFTSAITSKICMTISKGTLSSALLILILLPQVLAACDKIIMNKNKKIKTLL